MPPVTGRTARSASWASGARTRFGTPRSHRGQGFGARRQAALMVAKSMSRHFETVSTIVGTYRGLIRNQGFLDAGCCPSAVLLMDSPTQVGVFYRQSGAITHGSM